MPRLKDESLQAFMRRVTKASFKDGICYLLLTEHAPADQLSEYGAAWDEAAALAQAAQS